MSSSSKKIQKHWKANGAVYIYNFVVLNQIIKTSHLNTLKALNTAITHDKDSLKIKQYL